MTHPLTQEIYDEFGGSFLQDGRGNNSVYFAHEIIHDDKKYKKNSKSAIHA